METRFENFIQISEHTNHDVEDEETFTWNCSTHFLMQRHFTTFLHIVLKVDFGLRMTY